MSPRSTDPVARTSTRGMRGERRMIKVANFRARWYWLGTIGWITYFASPILPGWLIGQLFDEFQKNGSTVRSVVLIILIACSELAIVFGIAVAHRVYVIGLESGKALMRANVLDAQLASGGPGAARRDVSIGDVLVRLRDDPHDMLFLIDNWVDLAGSLIYGSAAAFFLVRIDPWAALAGIGPLILVGIGNRAIAHKARRYRASARASASDVSGFLTAAFEASLTVKVTGARRQVMSRLSELNASRGRTAVADSVWNETIWTLNSTLADVFVGVAIVVAARGPLSSGEVTLFLSYLMGMTWLPMRLGNLVTGRRRYEVSAQRMGALVAATTEDDRLTEHRPMTILGGPEQPGPTRPARDRLERLDVKGLTVVDRGLVDVNLSVERGQLVVISGPVGSGKSTLLRAIIGLTPVDSGTVSWNGQEVTDRAAFFVPPQCAYVAQVPRLFAESLIDNLRLSHDIEEESIRQGISLAALDDDVSQLPEGLSTLVGARGVRLSGGQLQRAAGARAMAHRPELLVLDDLTSALDVETELLMWERLAASGFTVLAASNRTVALERADVVITLGR